MRIGIIGLGLMGGSIGLSIKHAPFISKILGMDHNNFHEKEALKLDLVDEITDFNGIQKCDIIILTVPVEAIISILNNFDAINKHTTIIDMGSTKARIVEAVPESIRQNFVAAHPMTGTEKFGPSAALTALYTDKVVVLCDLEHSGELQRTRAIQLFEELHMRIVKMGAIEHDEHVAFISHLPHALSFALANTVLTHEDRKSILNLAAGGFKDMSRLAKSSPNMWVDVFKQNKSNLLNTIEIFEKELSRLKDTVNRNDWKALHQQMEHANSLHDIL